MLHNPVISFPAMGVVMSPAMVQQEMRAAIREWVEGVLARHRVSARAAALQAGISPSTVYRALEANGSFVMSTTTLVQLAKAYGEQLPDALRPAGMAAVVEDEGFREELTPFEGAARADAPPPAHVLAPAPVGHFRINNRALDLEGFLPGDLVEVDLNLPPVPGDIVCAQVYNLQRGTAETVLRKYLPPYLLTRSTDRAADLQPLYIDNQRVVLRGTVVAMHRHRAA
jgi:DNA-binding phage protein